MSFNELFSKLNEEQQEAVLDIHGPSMVVAGPGAGKTSVLVARTANMIKNGISPSNILLFTFTKKAANEIRERINNVIGEEANSITIGTYHSLCSRILRQYCTTIGLNKRYTIYDQEDSLAILKKIVKEFDTKCDIDIVAKKLAYYKHNMISPTDALRDAQGQGDLEILFANIYEKYYSEMMKNNSVDFDMLIYLTVRILEGFPDVKNEINKKYVYIVADESHDSSISDLRLIYNLAGEKENICMIADNDQSIYGFRGSQIEAVMNMRNIFSNMRTHVLNINYRSTQTIVNASKSLIDHNTKLIEKNLVSNNEKGESILYFQEKNTVNEANRIISLIMLATKKYNYKYNDIAILYRMNYLSRQIEDSLLKNKIPYKIIGGISFYNRKEIKDIMSYFKFIFNDNDSISLTRAIENPKRSIGEKTIEKIIQNSMEKEITLMDSIKELNSIGKTKNKFSSFICIIDKLKNDIDNETPDALIKMMLDETNYLSYLEKSEKKEAFEDRKQNIDELMQIASTFDSMEEFVENMMIDIESIEDNENEEDCVKLLTIHSSKGLEWKVVIIVGANEGTIPSFRAKSISEIEEERRLAYVAMTRAKEMLFITRPLYTMVKGRYTLCKESRFLNEINKDYIFNFNSVIA